MTVSNSVALKNNLLDQQEVFIGTAPKLRVYSGSIPADVAASLGAAVLLAEGSLPSDWMAAASSGVKGKTGTWSLTGQSGAGAGAAGTFARLWDTAGTTAFKQMTFGANVVVATSALTAANSNVLTFASGTGIAVGQKATGTGIPAETTVIDVSGGTVKLSKASTAGVSSGASITFGYDMVIDNNSIANAQSITVSQFDITAGN